MLSVRPRSKKLMNFWDHPGVHVMKPLRTRKSCVLGGSCREQGVELDISLENKKGWTCEVLSVRPRSKKLMYFMKSSWASCHEASSDHAVLFSRRWLLRSRSWIRSQLGKQGKEVENPTCEMLSVRPRSKKLMYFFRSSWPTCNVEHHCTNYAVNPTFPSQEITISIIVAAPTIAICHFNIVNDTAQWFLGVRLH
jgi:hypothetical protein